MGYRRLKVYLTFSKKKILKVRQFQNEFMKSSFLPKYEQKIVKISALTTQGRNPDDFLFVFWEKWWLHKFIFEIVWPLVTEKILKNEAESREFEKKNGTKKQNNASIREWSGHSNFSKISRFLYFRGRGTIFLVHTVVILEGATPSV